MFLPLFMVFYIDKTCFNYAFEEMKKLMPYKIFLTMWVLSHKKNHQGCEAYVLDNDANNVERFKVAIYAREICLKSSPHVSILGYTLIHSLPT